MSNQDECEQPASFTVSVSLKANEIEVMEQLFFFGPTWDGHIVSKAGRDQLFDLKLASRVEGYSFLTADGIRWALRNGLDRKRTDGRVRRILLIRELEAALHEIADFSEQFIGDDEDGDERMYKVNQIADTALAAMSENKWWGYRENKHE